MDTEGTYCAVPTASLSLPQPQAWTPIVDYCLHNMPIKRRLVASEICFGTEKAGLLDSSYNKCALEFFKLNENGSIKRALLCFQQSNDFRLIIDFSWQQFKTKRKLFDQKRSPLFLQIERFLFDNRS